MSDDSFIREVEEELRSDQLKNFWDRFKYLIIGGAVGLVVATAGTIFWNDYQESVAGESGDKFVEAVELSNDGKIDEAIAMLEALSKDGVGEYPALAKIRLAAEFARKGEARQAIEAYDTIANDTSFNETLRSVARLRSGLLLVDHGSFDEVSDRLEQMAGAGLNFRHSAREGMGLSAWKEKKYKDAHKWFSEIAADFEAPNGTRGRADVMLQLLAGKGITSAPESENQEATEGDG